VTDAERERFDQLVDRVVAGLPSRIHDLLDEVPMVVLDQPEPEMLRDLGIAAEDADALDEICGLHTGTMLTERSVELGADLPTVVHIFRRGVIALAGGWNQDDAEDQICEEIRITILHELGHHFGLDEDDLADLGYD
jgi:predicted Zn-dependent protease with MMP-like domain